MIHIQIKHLICITKKNNQVAPMQAMDNMNVIIEVLKIQETIAKAHEYFQNDEQC
jgi:hypothetical protein